MSTQVIKSRINSIDILRGLVMVIMALDHVRDFFSDYQGNPTDLQQVSTMMFFTRFITHYCAPVFIFLAGSSAFLAMGKGRTVHQESFRLLTRGLWLILVEVTIVRLGWTFNFDYSLVILQVIWAIGVSMVVLSLLIYLPRFAILSIGLLMIFGHDMFDNLHPAGAAGIVWQFLHVQGPLHYGHNDTLFIIYPLIPWIGVMAAGYSFGALFHLPPAQRFRWQYIIGIGSILLFIALRLGNIYGDPAPWHTQSMWWRSLLSFINVSKYPPSLQYILLTLGPAITLLPLLEQLSGRAASIFTVYGRVPMFYYILHIYLIHGLAVVSSILFFHGAPVSPFSHPGFHLWVVYAVWLLVVLLLYLPCRWFMGIKKSHHQWWLSYL